MYEVEPRGDQPRPSLGLFMLIFGGAYAVILCSVYVISLYTYYSAAMYRPRATFVVVMPLINSTAFYFATALYRMLACLPTPSRPSLALSLLVLHYPLSILGAVWTSALALRYPDEPILTVVIWQGLVVGLSSGIGALLLVASPGRDRVARPGRRG